MVDCGGFQEAVHQTCREAWGGWRGPAESGQGFPVSSPAPPCSHVSQLPSATLGRPREEHAGRASAASPHPRSQQLPTRRMSLADPAAPVTLAAELRSGNPTLVSALPPLLCDLDPNHLTFWALVSPMPFPSPSPHPPTSHTGQIISEKRTRVSLSSLERPHKRKALLASLLLNINNGISIVYYKPEKEVPRALGRNG